MKYLQYTAITGICLLLFLLILNALADFSIKLKQEKQADYELSMAIDKKDFYRLSVENELKRKEFFQFLETEKEDAGEEDEPET